MVTTVVLARALEPAGFGTYSAVANTASSAYGVVRLGVDGSIHVHAAELHAGSDSQRVMSMMLSAGLSLLLLAGGVGAISCFLLADWVAITVYGQLELGRWLKVAGFLVVMQCIAQFCFVTLAGLHRFGIYARIMMASATLTMLIVGTAAYCWGLLGALVSLLIAQALTTFGFIIVTRRVLAVENIPLQLGAIGHWVITHLRVGFPFYVSGLLSIPAIYFVQGMLSRYAGLDVLGYLRVLSTLLVFISFVPSSAAAAMVSLLTRSSSVDYGSFIAQSLINLKYVWLFAIFSGLAVFTLLPWLVDLLFGESYQSVVIPSSLAILSAITNCLLGVVGNILFARRRVWTILQQTVFQVSVFVGTAVLLIPSYGLGGYLAAELLGGLAGLLFLWIASTRWRAQYMVSPTWLSAAVLLSLTTAAILLTLSYSSVADHRVPGMIIVCVVAGVVSYFLILERDERAALGAILHRSILRKPM